MLTFRSAAVACLAACLAAGLALPPSWAAAQDVDITGHYAWDGMKDGEDYAILKNGEVYQVAWRLKSGTWIGVAIRDGDRLSVAWDFPNGGNLGVAVYRIEKGEGGPSLVGKWAAYQDKLATKDTYRWSRKLD